MKVNDLSWLTYSLLCFLGVNVKSARLLPTYLRLDTFTNPISFVPFKFFYLHISECKFSLSSLPE